VTRPKIGVGVIGLGIISDAHIRGLEDAADKANIVAICDIDEAKARRGAEPFGAVVYSDYCQLLADPRVEAVDIILPHNLHYPVACAAIEAGKHVLIEKPLTLSSQEGADLIDRARARGITFSVAENTRFVAAYLEVEKILKSGELGKIYSVRTLIAGTEIYRLVDKSTWKGDKEGAGGVIMDAAPHTFYLLRWLFGGIHTLRAYQQKLVSVSEVEDNAVVFGELLNGALFTAQFSFTTQAPWTERLEINGEHASIIIDQIVNPVGILFRGTYDFSGRPLAIPYNPENWKALSIAVEVTAFIDALWNSTPPGVDPADANYAVYAVEKVYESVCSGGKLVIL
jgi:predicted dehydrogenase